MRGNYLRKYGIHFALTVFIWRLWRARCRGHGSSGRRHVVLCPLRLKIIPWNHWSSIQPSVEFTSVLSVTYSLMWMMVTTAASVQPRCGLGRRLPQAPTASVFHCKSHLTLYTRDYRLWLYRVLKKWPLSKECVKSFECFCLWLQGVKNGPSFWLI